MLGTDAQPVQAMLESNPPRSLAARAPWAVFGVFPLVALLATTIALGAAVTFLGSYSIGAALIAGCIAIGHGTVRSLRGLLPTRPAIRRSPVPRRFVMLGLPITISFQANINGTVTEALFNQAGRNIKAPRVSEEVANALVSAAQAPSPPVPRNWAVSISPHLVVTSVTGTPDSSGRIGRGGTLSGRPAQEASPHASPVADRPFKRSAFSHTGSYGTGHPVGWR